MLHFCFDFGLIVLNFLSPWYLFWQGKLFYSSSSAASLASPPSSQLICCALTSSSGAKSTFATQAMSSNEPVVSVDWLHANLKEPDVKVPALTTVSVHRLEVALMRTIVDTITILIFFLESFPSVFSSHLFL